MLTTENITIILFFIPIYQLIFYTVQLITFKRNVYPARWYLGLLLLSLSVFLIISTLFYLDYQQTLVWAYYLFTAVFLLPLPFYYNYLSGITAMKKKSILDCKLFAFSPSILIFILTIFSYGKLTFLEKITFLHSGFTLAESSQNKLFTSENVFILGFVILAFIQLSWYSFRVFVMINNFKKNENQNASYQPFVQTHWLSAIFISLALFILANIFFHLFSEDFRFSVLLIYNIIMLITGASIGYMGMKQENLYTYISQLSGFKLHGNSEKNEMEYDRAVDISNEEKVLVLNGLTQLMEQKKIFLNSKLSIDELAEILHTNKRSISIVVNDKTGMNIYGFINQYRIEESKRIIADNNMQYLSMEGIAKQVGFTSKSCFYASFKKVTGKTPSQFKSENSNLK